MRRQPVCTVLADSPIYEMSEAGTYWMSGGRGGEGEGGRKGRTKKIPNAEAKSFFREAQELP